MKMIKILCSTGALIGRPNGRNYKLLKPLSKQLTCDGFEFMMYDSWYSEVETLKKYLQDLNLYIPIVHCEKRIGENISKGGDENFIEAFEKFDSVIAAIVPQENAAADDGMVDALMEIIIGIRQNARKAKDWGTADAIRDQLKELGIVLEDGADGVRWKKA